MEDKVKENKRCNHPEWETISEFYNEFGSDKSTKTWIQKCKRCGMIRKIKV